MAIGRLSPLLNSLAGSVGNSTFARIPGGSRVSAKAGPRSSTAARALAVRVLAANAAANWRALANVDRALWESAAAELHLTGAQAYMRAWLHQAGDPAPVAPSVPSILAVLPVHGVYETDELKLTLTALSRDLLPLEYCLFRAHVALPSDRALNSRTIHGYTRVNADQGLATLPAYVFKSDASTNNTYSASILYNPTTWTIEGWLRRDGQFSLTQSVGWVMSSPWIAYYAYLSGHSLLNIGGIDFNLGAPLPLHTWCYVALSANTATSTWTIYVNGAPIGAPHAYTPQRLWGALDLGGYAPNVNSLRGRFGEFRISTVARSAAEIAAIWNNGAPRRFTVDASTLDYWPMRTIVTGASPDLGPNNKPLTVVGDTLAPGPFCRDLYLPADTPYTTPRTVQIDVQALRPTWMLTPPVKDLATW
jgi:hypothetical protein